MDVQVHTGSFVRKTMAFYKDQRHAFLIFYGCHGCPLKIIILDEREAPEALTICHQRWNNATSPKTVTSFLMFCCDWNFKLQTDPASENS